MHSLARFVAGALAVSNAAAVFTGFNYGDKHSDGSVKQQSDYETEFSTAKNLVGASGFTSARLYTSVQDGTTDPISAIPAAIAEDTSLLLGLWASAGQQNMDKEIAAIKSAVDQFGDSFTSRVAGISVGSEDLYRQSVIGMQNNAGIGEGPDTIASYINQVRSAVANSALSSVPIGHVDTWTVWVNGSNKAVVEACDFIGFDAYPYFQGTMPNSIEDAKALFQEAMSKTQAAVGGKPIWVTETGWPVSGPTVNQAVPSLQNAQTYWEEVGCNLLFGNVNTWWYTLRDAEPVVPNPSFGVVGSDLSTTPLYNLSCSAALSSSSAAGGATKPTSGSATAATSGSSPSPPSGSSTPISIPTSKSQGPSASASGGAGSGSGGNVPSASRTPSASGGVGGGSSGNAPSATRSPSVSGGVGGGIGGNGPSVSGTSGAGSGLGGGSSQAPTASGTSGAGSGLGSGSSQAPTASGTSGAGGGLGGGSSQASTALSPSMSPSSPSPSAPQFTGAASVAAAPTMRLVGAVVAMIAFL